MKISSIPLNCPGSYLFHDNSKLTFSLDRELGVVFCVPTEQTVGVVLFHPDNNIHDLHFMMDNILNKMLGQHQIARENILVKVFGLSLMRKGVLETTYRWLKDRNLFISAEDTGKNYLRQVLVDCGTGRVGVSYRTEDREIPYLATTTARDRNPLDEIYAKVLVLSSSPTKRTLAKQSIEEHKNWVAETPNHPSHFLSKKPKQVPYSVIVLFEDMNEKPDDIVDWVETIHQAQPEVQFRYSGKEIPKFLQHLKYMRQLPPLTPFLLPEFKGTLARAVFDFEVNSVGEIIPLKKKKASTR